ncbi:MAG: thiamine phosphate synthase [Candidatus Omnitrophica bacterium]|nr:thiamine phosphate synthase [Candidatus Omnitrophota bacterium]
MKRSLKKARLYLVLDTQVNDYDQLMSILKSAVGGGIDIVQLRDKMGSTRLALKFLQDALRYLKRKIPLIVNDRVDWALAVGADGVHVGQDDLPLEATRKLVGSKMLVGTSCQTLEQARRAQRQGADYIGFGSVFKTFTKPERSPMDAALMKRVASTIFIPVFFIGGIDHSSIADVCQRGGRRVALTRAISLAKNVKVSAQKLKQAIEQYPLKLRG